MREPLTAQQAANELGYNIKYFYHLVKNGTIRARRFGRVWMVDPAEIERLKALQGKGGRLPKARK